MINKWQRNVTSVNSKSWSVGPMLTLAVMGAFPVLLHCGAVNKLSDAAPDLPGTGGDCPSDPSAIMKATWGLDAELEGKVKGGLAAAANLSSMALAVEGEVTAACTKLAKDLGASDADVAAKSDEPGQKADAACKAAAKFIGEVKAKASGTVTLDIKPPVCSASMDAMASCAGECDAKVDPGKAEVTCEGGEISGSCSGKCEGKCTVEAGAECSGECGGSCSGECKGDFSGKCEGTCDGKCDGKNTKGKCQGTCEGSCKGKAEGSCSGGCKGKCDASCSVDAKGECKGTCSGKCDVKMEAPKCSGEVKPPEMSAECKASCDAQVSGKLECTPARVAVKIAGAADAAAASKLRGALEANLPALLKVAIGMKGKLEGAAAGVETSVKGLTAVVEGGADAALKVGACVKGALEAQVKATASINVSVQASASVKGSAEGSAG